jgi:hypothetical protein
LAATGLVFFSAELKLKEYRQLRFRGSGPDFQTIPAHFRW